MPSSIPLFVFPAQHALPGAPRLVAALRRVCAYWLGVRPQTFYLLYCGIGAVMMLARWLLYLSRK